MLFVIAGASKLPAPVSIEIKDSNEVLIKLKDFAAQPGMS